jgi:NAD(P)H-hydrate epimerase
MVFTLADKEGSYEGGDAEKILPLLEKADVLAIGPGMTTHQGSLNILTYILENRRIPIVIDADGLNLLASSMKDNTKLIMGGETVLTPHPGEMARLTEKSIEEIIENPLGIVREYAAQTKAVIVLKGSTSIIAHPDGQVTFNITGNAGMAKGGSGDVLTGIICALLGQGLSAYDAARVGCYIHGLAGDLAAEKMGLAAITAGDLVEMLPETILKLNR